MGNNKIRVRVKQTPEGFNAVCDELEGWIVAVDGHDIDEFTKNVVESINYYVECCEKDGDPIPEALRDGSYTIAYDVKLTQVDVEDGRLKK